MSSWPSQSRASLGGSTALLADSVDMLGDAIVYGFSLDVVARGAVWQARVALLKGLIMAAFGIGVLAQVGDVNMRSAWVCSLNDEGGNAAVLWPALPSRSRFRLS